MRNIEVLLDDFLEKEIVSAKDIDVHKGENVIVNIDGSLYSGEIISTDINTSTKNFLVRIVTKDDMNVIVENKKMAEKALKDAKKIKDTLNLDMSFVDCYYTYDKKQLYFLYVADERVDFRNLAKKLADKYKTRIELRQIGVRDKAKRVGGLGPCGLFLCCNSFLTDFNSVSINMAKNQFLALNPTKINGVCGRLLCCLNYENETYKREKELAPKIGSIIETKKGKGKVTSIDIIKHTCVVELDERNSITIDYNEKVENNESTK